jgi:hypothetical protein
VRTSYFHGWSRRRLVINLIRLPTDRESRRGTFAGAEALTKRQHRRLATVLSADHGKRLASTTTILQSQMFIFDLPCGRLKKRRKTRAGQRAKRAKVRTQDWYKDTCRSSTKLGKPLSLLKLPSQNEVLPQQTDCGSVFRAHARLERVAPSIHPWSI